VRSSGREEVDDDGGSGTFEGDAGGSGFCILLDFS
jgi:hypothetical protein